MIFLEGITNQRQPEPLDIIVLNARTQTGHLLESIQKREIWLSHLPSTIMIHRLSYHSRQSLQRAQDVRRVRSTRMKVIDVLKLCTKKKR